MYNGQVFIIGDKPSSKNMSPDVPFVGTKSYRTLLGWIADLDLSVTDIVLCNIEHLKLHENSISVEVNNLYTDIQESDIVIALGRNAQKYMSKTKIKYFGLPHPSPRNRLLNDKKHVNIILNQCKELIHERG